ncbi:MAG: Na+/H+ antiporter NhaC, partial [Spirochaetes bacterium]|nr:Na+/H+ antiporter NhaC [Spirochaetota bacterium]
MAEARMPKIWQALIPVLALIAFLSFSIILFGSSPHIPIIGATIVAVIVAMVLGHKWKDLEEGIVNTIKMSMQAILILMVIGMVIGSWILSGTVPALIFYGLKLLSPAIFLTATCLICAVVSLATGSSWTTAGTVGVALMGVAAGLGVPPGMAAGAIISGAYFGDKMSPLSDTTNLAPAMAGSNLFDHIKHMAYTTGPALLIALVIYTILGFGFAGKSIDTSAVAEITDTLKATFNINPFLLIPPVVVIVLVVRKMPALPGLLIGALLGTLFAAIFQGAFHEITVGSLIDNLHYGFSADTGVGVVDDLLSRGGLDSMMWTVSLILCAMTFGGVMEKAGFLEVLARGMLKIAKGRGGLVLATELSCVATNMMAGDQYLSIVIPGRMFKTAFDEAGLAPKNLSRCLEDAGTITSPFFSWNTCGAFMSQTLGVSPLAYG